MSTIPVFAGAASRLHADIILIRLLRSGIRPALISVVFSRRRAPNSVCCWLKGFLPVSSQLTSAGVTAAGPLAAVLSGSLRAGAITRGLASFGLELSHLQRLLEKAAGGQIGVCVHARNETEAVIAWHIFQHVNAEDIACPGLGSRQQPPAAAADEAPRVILAA